MLSLLVVCYLLSGLFLFIYYRKAHPWKEVVNTQVQFCCLPSTPISPTCDENSEDENIADNNIEMGEVHSARPLDDNADQDVVWRLNFN